MISVLDMLQSRLRDPNRPLTAVEQDMIRGMGTGPSAPPMTEADRRLRAMGPIPPSDLPEAVWDSLLNRPTYGEGEIMAPSQYWNQAEGGQLRKSGPQREETLLFDRGQALGIPNPFLDYDPRSHAMPEGGVWSSRPSGASPFASPLNQLMKLGRRAPLALY